MVSFSRETGALPQSAQPLMLPCVTEGLNRVQECPRIRQEMSDILSTVQRRSGGRWVGLSVVHLGDRDVPNALTFIDKYNQVPLILTGVESCVNRLPALVKDERTAAFLNLHGGAKRVQMEILRDFFKHGFDGSGDDGGSCIDGRLTSASLSPSRDPLVSLARAGNYSYSCRYYQ
jgi:hypothetical protein